MFKPVFLFASSLLILGCQHSKGPDGSFLKSEFISHDGHCQDFVNGAPGTNEYRIGLNLEIPTGMPDSLELDYLLIIVYGYDPLLMDASACAYYSRKIEVEDESNIENKTKEISASILAGLSKKNRHYLSIEGYQRKGSGIDMRVLARNAPPINVALDNRNYEIDSFIWLK